MIITAIDPGTTESAFVQFDSGKQEILAHGKVNNMEVMLAFSEGGTVACEMVESYGMPVGKEIFQTVLWVGRYWEACRWMGCYFHLIYRAEVKQTLCFSMKANDAAIRQRLIDLLGPPGTKPKPGKTYGIHRDEWQALGVALTYLKKYEHRDQQNLPALHEANPIFDSGS